MKGDFTRFTFDPTKQFSRALMQQGRVQLDADWNAQAAIFTHYLRALARDLIGPHGAPAGDAGFGVVIDPSQITKRDGTLLKDGKSAVDKNLFSQLSNSIKTKGAFVINPGIYYVEGIRVENAAPVFFGDQRGFDVNAFGDASKGPYQIYLDVWERHVTHEEDSHLREVALGGPDTTTRVQIIWQVKLLPRVSQNNPCDVSGLPRRPGTGKLRARAKLGAQNSPCAIASTATYRGAENQLYRVEILKDGSIAAGDAPSFVWSRENGSVVFPIINLGSQTTSNGVTQMEVTLANLGRDAKLGLKCSDWVSLIDDAATLQERGDALLQVMKVDRDTQIVTLQGTTQVVNTGTHKLLRRWDQKTGVDTDGAIAVREASAPTPSDPNVDVADGNWITLEDGVQIWFAPGGTYCTGDYWLIPARVATGDVEWPSEILPDGTPRKIDDNNVPAELPPEGPHHYYAPLGSMNGGGIGNQQLGRACECLIEPLADCDSDKAKGSAAKPSVKATKQATKARKTTGK